MAQQRSTIASASELDREPGARLCFGLARSPQSMNVGVHCYIAASELLAL